MSKRYQGGILGVGFNPLQTPNAPTIGTATAVSATAVSVTFTAPANVGGSPITSYVVQSNPGGISVVGSSSPITVSGLTEGTAYTFRVTALNSYGPSPASGVSNSATPAVTGQQAYTTAGTYSWVAPAGVTSVSVVCVGGGAFGAGGGLGWKNNITVIPGNSYSLRVGNRSPAYGNNGQSSYFIDEATVRGGGATWSGAGGTYTGDGGGNGGTYGGPYAGAGAGGYTGNGANGPSAWNTNGLAGSGGGGGSGASFDDNSVAYWGGGGGGVGILGLGSNGAGGVLSGSTTNGGGGGSGGQSGAAGTNAPSPGNGGSYGGGGGGTYVTDTGVLNLLLGAAGAVRIIWPASGRSFPSTNTGNV